ncbi:MAG: hypothetical protein ACYTAO_23280 [Planctomycetota bacterium]
MAVTERLASESAIAGFELNISCPNVAKGGVSFGRDPEQVAEITSAVKKAAGEKVLMVKLSPTVTDISVIAAAAVEAGADALSDGHRRRDAQAHSGQPDRRALRSGHQTDRRSSGQQGL